MCDTGFALLSFVPIAHRLGNPLALDGDAFSLFLESSDVEMCGARHGFDRSVDDVIALLPPFIRISL